MSLKNECIAFSAIGAD